MGSNLTVPVTPASSALPSASSWVPAVNQTPAFSSFPSSYDPDILSFDVPQLDDVQPLSFSSFPPELLPAPYKQHYENSIADPSAPLFPTMPAAASAMPTRQVTPAPVAVAAAPAVQSPASAPLSPGSPSTMNDMDEEDDDKNKDSAYRKELHRNTERMRRQKTSDAMTTLRALTGGRQKKKLAILMSAIEQLKSNETLIKELKQQNMMLSAKANRSSDVKVETVGAAAVDWGSVFLHNDACMALSSLDMKLVAVNHSFVQQLGHKLSSDLSWQALAPPENMADVYSVMSELLSGKSTTVFRPNQRVLTASGKVITAQVSFSLVRSPTQIQHILMTVRPL